MPGRDYTTGIKVDPNSRFIVSASQVDILDLPRDEDAYIYWDEGVDFFNADLEHDFDVYIDSASDNVGHGNPWGLNRTINDLISSADCLYINSFKINIDGFILLRESDGGSNTSDTSIAISLDTWHYGTVTYVKSTNNLMLKIYSNALRTILVDTLSITRANTTNFQYLYGLSSANTGNVNKWTGKVANLDLVVPGHIDISNSLLLRRRRQFIRSV